MKLEYNFIIQNQYLVNDEKELFFCGEDVEYLSEETDMLDILVKCEIFSSKSQARKSGKSKDIPEGFTDLTIGKLKKKICIFKANEKNLLLEEEK